MQSLIAIDGDVRTTRGAQWCAALRDLQIAHPDPACAFGVVLYDRPDFVTIETWARVRDTRDAAVWRERQVIHCVKCPLFPGAEAARTFVAGIFVAYMTHECWELVRHPQQDFSPHAEPYPTNPYNAVFRRAAPAVLDEETLREALSLWR